MTLYYSLSLLVSNEKHNMQKNILSAHFLKNMPCNPWQHKELDDAEAVAGCRCCHGDSRQHRWRRDQSEQTAGRVRLISLTQTHTNFLLFLLLLFQYIKKDLTGLWKKIIEFNDGKIIFMKYFTYFTL